MGVEPTVHIYAMPATDFEDRGPPGHIHSRERSAAIVPPRQRLVKW